MVKRLPVYDDAEEALFEAQDLMYDAFEESDAGRRRALAVEALTISPDCADAYLLLAEETPLEIEQNSSCSRPASPPASGRSAPRRSFTTSAPSGSRSRHTKKTARP